MNEPEYEYEIEGGGTVYLRILMAEEDRFYSGGKNVEELRGRVQLSTDPKWGADTDLGCVKIRGRKYGIEHIVMRLSGDRADRHGKPYLWQAESSYFGGYRNDRGQQVKHDAKAWDCLRDIEHEVLGRFEKEHPDWQTISVRRLYKQKRNSAIREAERLRGEASDADRKAAKWQTCLDELSDGGDGHCARPDDRSEDGDRCKDCGKGVTRLGPGTSDWEHVKN